MSAAAFSGVGRVMVRMRCPGTLRGPLLLGTRSNCAGRGIARHPKGMSQGILKWNPIPGAPPTTAGQRLCVSLTLPLAAMAPMAEAEICGHDGNARGLH